MKKITLIVGLCVAAILFIAGCAQHKDWKYKDTITLQQQVHPLGIAENDGDIWVSAPAQKKLLHIDEQGKILDQKTDLPRPMHITAAGGKIYIPLYLKDRVVSMEQAGFDTLSLGALPDAPAGVSVKGDTIAVADFYNHRIILQIGDKTTTIGKEGHGKGQLYYPTDVELSDDKIYVADAYNNRVQVFDFDGNSLQLIGDKGGINVATGLTVYNNQLFVTDFFGNKILVYNANGELTQTLTGHFDKPTDIAVINGDLYIPNYGVYSVVRYAQK